MNVWRHLALAAAFGVVACTNTPATVHSQADSAQTHRQPQVAAADVAAAIRVRLSSRSLPEIGTLDSDEHQAVESLYTPAADGLWIDAAGRPAAHAREMIALLESSSAEGLDPREYGVPLVANLARTLESAGSEPAPERIASFDVVLSAAALRYFAHLHVGRIDPRTIGYRLHAPAERHEMVSVLRTAIASRRIVDAAAELAPPLDQYRLLRGMLGRYRAIAADAPAPVAMPFAAALHPGDPASSTLLRALARLLVVLGDLAPNDLPDPPAIYATPLVEAVKRFQRRHGLDPDGVLGRATQAALNVPIAWRVRQIELSLERLRWLPDLANGRVIGLNIPMFHLWAWDASRADGRPAFETRAIVGRAVRTETPVFVEELREVIFRPYWNVPRSILLSEILPLVSKDPAYLERQEMEIVQGPGDDARPVAVNNETLALLRQGALRLRQRPGPKNALGLVKFVFPNNDNVYLHSTPAQELFSKARRDFSHGCVRVEDPVALAEWVLKDQPDWTRDRIVAAMSAAAPTHVTVRLPIQVVLFYSTAGVFPEDGTIHFAEDIYRHDALLDRALTHRRRP